jgi:hypothetical protein
MLQAPQGPPVPDLLLSQKLNSRDFSDRTYDILLL